MNIFLKKEGNGGKKRNEWGGNEGKKKEKKTDQQRLLTDEHSEVKYSNLMVGEGRKQRGSKQKRPAADY